MTKYPDLSHIAPNRRGCLTCLSPDCPVWQAADQNCWKPAPSEQEIRYSAIIHHNISEYKAPLKISVFHDDTCQSDVMHLAINDRVVGALLLLCSKQGEL